MVIIFILRGRERERERERERSEGKVERKKSWSILLLVWGSLARRESSMTFSFLNSCFVEFSEAMIYSFFFSVIIINPI